MALGDFRDKFIFSLQLCILWYGWEDVPHELVTNVGEAFESALKEATRLMFNVEIVY